MKPAATSRQARSTQDKTAEAAEQQVREVHKINDEAVLKADVATLAANFADEITVILGNGAVATKAELIEWFRSGKVKCDSIETSDTKVHIYGDTAVITATTTVARQAFGNPTHGQERNTYVLVKRNGKWLAVLHQMTPIVPAKAESGAGR